MAVGDERLVEGRWVGSKPRRPVVVADDNHLRLADGPIVAGPEQPAKGWYQTQRGEVAARHEQPVAVERLPLIRQVCRKTPVRRKAGEGLRFSLEITKHRIAEHHITAAGLAARLRSWLRSRHRQVDQSLR